MPGGRLERVQTSALRALAAAVVACSAVCATPAAAAPEHDVPQWRRHGLVARHLWTPSFTHREIGGLRLSAGVAFGVRKHWRHAIGAPVASAIVLETGRRSNLTLLATPEGGAMLVWQRRD